MLGATVRPERQYHHAAVGELPDERLRHLLGRRRHDDAVVRRALRHAGKSVTHDHLDVLVAERGQRARAVSASVR